MAKCTEEFVRTNLFVSYTDMFAPFLLHIEGVNIVRCKICIALKSIVIPLAFKSIYPTVPPKSIFKLFVNDNEPTIEERQQDTFSLFPPPFYVPRESSECCFVSALLLISCRDGSDPVPILLLDAFLLHRIPATKRAPRATMGVESSDALFVLFATSVLYTHTRDHIYTCMHIFGLFRLT